MRSLIMAMAVGAVALGCASGGSGGDRGGAAASDSSPLQTADVLVGDWSLAAKPPLQTPGLKLRVTIDSARGSSLFGRLTLYFSGDVGGDPAEYEPFVGTVDSNAAVAFTIRRRDPAMLGIWVVGRLEPDTILADTLVIGPDTATNMSGRSWFFVKERR